MTTEQTHTPGPWHWIPADPKSDKLAELVGADGSSIMDFGDAEQYYPTAGSEPSEADARLIAAAPELVEALEAARGTLERTVQLCEIPPDVSDGERRARRGIIRQAHTQLAALDALLSRLQKGA